MRRNTKANFAGLAWTLLASFVVLMLLAVFLVGYFRKKASEATESAAFGQFPGGSATSTGGKSVELPTIGEVEALSIVRAAFAQGNNQDPTRHFTSSDGASTGETHDALSRINALEGEITAYRWMGQKYVNGVVIGEVATQRETGGEYSRRLAQLVLGTDGKWRIDTDSYLRKCVPGWPEILSGESKTSIVRVFVAEDTYYNGIYSDDAEWRAYALVSPDTPEPVYGYARPGSPQEKALRKILAAEEEIHRASVEISVHPEAGRRQFEITGVLAENWVIGGTRFDESF